MDITTYGNEQFERIAARDLRPGHWLMRSGAKGNEVIHVESPVHVLADVVLVFSTITHSLHDFSFETPGKHVRAVWFDEETHALQCVKIEFNYQPDEMVLVLKSEFTPPAPEEDE